MDRRRFIGLSASSLAGLSLGLHLSPAEAAIKNKKYNLILLGDTHFDSEPNTVYHAKYLETSSPKTDKHRDEFIRNGEMWRERLPRLLQRAAQLEDSRTRMVLQMGDLVQGDCGSEEMHRQFLSDAFQRMKNVFSSLPFVPVVGNHDIRGEGAERAYHDFMPARISQELGKDIHKTTFSFQIGNDVFLFIDFNSPDDDEIERLLDDSKDARHTFIVSHGTILPFDGKSCRWFFHGGAGKENTKARRYFRKEFALRHAICLCGHTHKTEHIDWYGDGGRITQMIMNSVWADPELTTFKLRAEGAAQYGELRKKSKEPNLKDETALFDEYRPGLRTYIHGNGAGCYQLHVIGRHVFVDFYAGDAQRLTRRFILR